MHAKPKDQHKNPTNNVKQHIKNNKNRFKIQNKREQKVRE